MSARKKHYFNTCVAVECVFDAITLYDISLFHYVCSVFEIS